MQGSKNNHKDIVQSSYESIGIYKSRKRCLTGIKINLSQYIRTLIWCPLPVILQSWRIPSRKQTSLAKTQCMGSAQVYLLAKTKME